MSLPAVPNPPSQPQPTLLELLLQEQGDLSAVDRFSDWHESHSIAAATYQALMPTKALQSGQQYAFEVDLDACSGCKACVVACHTLNGLEDDETWRKVGLLTSRTIDSLPIVQHVTTACHHCVDPACLSGCPVQAYEKDPLTGIVRHLDDQCFGCKYCTMMCPYEVPQYSGTLGIVRKCDMCSQRLSIGEPPACVQACPNQAIRIAIVDVATVSAQTVLTPTTSLVSTAPLSRLTTPTTTYVTSLPQEATHNLLSIESMADRAQEGHPPLVVMIVLTQASIGMWIVLACMGIINPVSSQVFARVVATAIGVMGVHAALFHLGRPWLAFRAFLGWRTSWLSREAIAFGLFLGASSTATAIAMLLPQETRLQNICGAIASMTGVLAAMCTCMIYIATARELWGYLRTGFDFGLSTIGLGLVGAYASVEGLPSVFLVMGVLCSALAANAKVDDYLNGKTTNMDCDDFSGRSGRILRTQLANAWIALWIQHSVALLLAIGVCFIDMPGTFSLLPFATFAICLLAQANHRWLYFASVVHRRMPGVST